MWAAVTPREFRCSGRRGGGSKCLFLWPCACLLSGTVGIIPVRGYPYLGGAARGSGCASRLREEGKRAVGVASDVAWGWR